MHIYIYIYIYPGGLRPDRRAPGDSAEEGTFNSDFVFLKFVACLYISEHVFVCVFDTFSSDAPGSAKVSLGGTSGGQVCVFSSIF